MLLLGKQIPDTQKVKLALTSFYGLSHSLSARLCARLQLHNTMKIGDLSEAQVTQINAYLSSSSGVPARPSAHVEPPLALAAGSSSSSSSSSSTSSSPSSPPPVPQPLITTPSARHAAKTAHLTPPSQRADPAQDELRSLIIESDLRRAMRANIIHHRNVGSYRGRRHQQGLPVRGQRTQSNGQTAKRLNRIDRRMFSTSVGSSGAASAQAQRPSVLALLAAAKRPAAF